MFLKENLNFDYLQDDLIQRNILSERELKEYVDLVHEKYSRCEKFLKLIIKKKRCKEFVTSLGELPERKSIIKKIRKVKKNTTPMTLKGNATNEILILFVFVKQVQSFLKKTLIYIPGLAKDMPSFSVTDELLKKHFHLLYTVLEPRDIADEMFQACQISVNDHDHITDNPKKEKRIRNLLEVLEQKQLYASFLCIVKSLQYTSLLETLNTDRQSENYPCKYLLLIHYKMETCTSAGISYYHTQPIPNSRNLNRLSVIFIIINCVDIFFFSFWIMYVYNLSRNLCTPSK